MVTESQPSTKYVTSMLPLNFHNNYVAKSLFPSFLQRRKLRLKMLNNLGKVNMKVGVMTLDPNISSHLLHTPTPDYLQGSTK